MALVTSYNSLPISFVKGQGIWLFDETGEQYLDTLSGVGVCSLGHAHPEVTATIKAQAEKLLHTSNAVQIKIQLQLAEKLTKLTHMKQAFFSNSGSEANETAIKICRLSGHKKGIETPSIIVMEGAFHGRTMATLTASGSRKVQAGYEPLVPGFIRASYNDIEAIKTIAANRNDIVAVMLETIQGEGGIIVADPNYLQAVAALCKEKNWLLIIDEVQTGNARTGEMYSYMHFGIQPDIITTAKGLGNGIPISVCLMNDQACDFLKPGNHGSTFGGNPLSCATALTVLEILERDKICDKVSKKSKFFINLLEEKLGKNSSVRAIRGRGLMLGIELDRPAEGIKKIGLEKKILLNVTAENVIRLLPPLIISEEEIEILVTRLVETLSVFLNPGT